MAMKFGEFIRQTLIDRKSPDPDQQIRKL